MGEILIIERQPILREALRQFLFPEHHATVREGWLGAQDVAGHDLVIVDRDCLDAGEGAVDEVLGALARLGVPSVWLHTGPAPALRPKGRTAAVPKPLEVPALEAALRLLLPSASGDLPGVDAAEEGEPLEYPPPAGAIIELTEVVEDPDEEP
ncbi:MAG: hypothetical protein OXF11_00090 [Deltaproteobacteria bacterium]|nr:hypothetical protein [Deltaproteobacteria bacterium]